MFVCPDSGLEGRFVISFVSDIKDHDCTIVAAHSKQGRILRMEIKAHNTRFSCKLVLWPGRIFNSVTTNEPTALPQKVIGSITNSEQIFVPGIPTNSSNVLLSTFFS